MYIYSTGKKGPLITHTHAQLSTVATLQVAVTTTNQLGLLQSRAQTPFGKGSGHETKVCSQPPTKHVYFFPSFRLSQLLSIEICFHKCSIFISPSSDVKRIRLTMHGQYPNIYPSPHLVLKLHSTQMEIQGAGILPASLTISLFLWYQSTGRVSSPVLENGTKF